MAKVPLFVLVTCLVVTSACAPNGYEPGSLGLDSASHTPPGKGDHEEGDPAGAHEPARPQLLPVHMTEAEREQARIRRYDPRDNDPDYAFTNPPTDITTLPGEFEPVREVLLGWTDAAWWLEDFFEDLLVEAARESHVTLLTGSFQEADDLIALADELSIPAERLSVLSGESPPLESIWIRDYGPMAVRTETGLLRFIDPRYYPTRLVDDKVPTVLGRAWSVPVSRPNIEMEGGNFLSDGTGSCVTTEYVIDQNESRVAWDEDPADYVRDVFHDYFGCEQTIFVPALYGEETGHVDMLVHLTGPRQAIVGDYLDDDPYRDELNDGLLSIAANRLAAAGFSVRRVPMPYSSGRWVWRTYTNALAVNGAVLVPTYAEDPRHEAAALQVFAQAYPGKRIVPIRSDDVIEYAGAIHCVTATLAQ